MTAVRSAVIKADQARVWRAITTPEQISAWFDGSMKWEYTLAAGEIMTFYYQGKLVGHGKIVTVEPVTRFAFQWTPEPGNPTESLVTFVLEAVPDGTRVTISEAGFEKLPDEVRQQRYEMNGQGWSITLDHLASYLQEGDHA
ncbi:MAG TPA: SRPBCC domain-containing protein [Phototrophicaceae bacterium]|nr:SRPBCC domain-containing protein [Phototrophicaceae bacterium]